MLVTPPLGGLLISNASSPTQLRDNVKSVGVTFAGDPVIRVTIEDADIRTGSRILLSIQRASTDDADDPGFFYLANVVKVIPSSFDVVVVCTDEVHADATPLNPTESIEIVYSVLQE